MDVGATRVQPAPPRTATTARRRPWCAFARRVRRGHAGRTPPGAGPDGQRVARAAGPFAHARPLAARPHRRSPSRAGRTGPGPPSTAPIGDARRERRPRGRAGRAGRGGAHRARDDRGTDGSGVAPAVGSDRRRCRRAAADRSRVGYAWPTMPASTPMPAPAPGRGGPVAGGRPLDLRRSTCAACAGAGRRGRSCRRSRPRR